MEQAPNGDKKFSSAKQFYQSVQAEVGLDKINEACYVTLHTVYLNDVNYKRQIFVTWKSKLGVRLSDEQILYLQRTFRCFADRMYINILKSGEEIRRRDVLWQALISLEMDIALIDCLEQKKSFSTDEFIAALNQKYFGAFERLAKEVLGLSVPYVKDFNNLSRAIRPYKGKIKALYDQLMKSNAGAIDERVERFKRDAVKPVAQPNAPIELVQYEEKIRRLENDAVEYQRQRDEQIEYAQTQYDRGVRDLFKLLNDERYSRIVDYFYALQFDKRIDPNLRSYLENFFMALEEFEITPIVADLKLVPVEPDRLNQTYNLTFDRQHYDPELVEVKYPGWRFRNVILEKPTLAKKK
ncbi:MAG: hypothetical protein IJU71_03780 [Selenomonadaceae bacterium]|nr:hypothetical protein [Selenomonadaceae bacterium]